jgi:hypothetical protein
VRTAVSLIDEDDENDNGYMGRGSESNKEVEWEFYCLPRGSSLVYGLLMV